MRMYLDCMVCFVSHTLDSIRRLTHDERIHEQVMRELTQIIASADLSTPPPVISQSIHRTIRRALGQADPYAAAKRRFTDFALRMEDRWRKRIDQSPDPIAMAVRLAIAGNIIDFGTRSGVHEDEVIESIEHALAAPIDGSQMAAFKDEIGRASRIVYLADNAGEIVFDKLLIERLPREKILLVVKGSPIINDATPDDARDAGLEGMVRIIGNGNDAPGTHLPQCSREFLDAFGQADVVISKGQANFELLDDCGRPIWFLLKVKCPMVARFLERPMGEIVFEKYPKPQNGECRSPNDQRMLQ